MEQDNQLAVNIPKPVAVRLALFMQDAERERKESHSVEYYVIDALSDYIVAKRRSWKTTEAAKNAKSFVAEITADPTIKNDPARFNALQQKFHIGGTQVDMSAVDKLTAKLSRIDNLAGSTPAAE